MPIQICWRPEVHGESTQHVLSVAEAELLLTMTGGVITDASWRLNPERLASEPNAWMKQLQQQLQGCGLLTLRLELLQQGSAYSRKVWQAMLEIPFGRVVSYTELAEKLNSGPRAVAQACRSNPYPGIIPCHRVVAKSGIGGFMGCGQGEWVAFKRRLLLAEGCRLELGQ